MARRAPVADCLLRSQWEDVDHELENVLSDAVISPVGGSDGELGLGTGIKYVKCFPPSKISRTNPYIVS